MIDFSNDSEDKLKVIVAMIAEAMNKDVLCSTRDLFEDILFIAGVAEEEEEQENKLIISIDYIVKDSSTFSAWVIQRPNGNITDSYMPLPSKDVDEAALDSIYTILGAITIEPSLANPDLKIEFYIPNRKIVKLLNAEIGCLGEEISHKVDSVLEIVNNLGYTVRFGWRPSNSTQAMKAARERLPC